MTFNSNDWNNKLRLTIDSSKIDEDLINFPALITLSSGTGITNFDTTDVFDKLEPTMVSGTAVSGTYDDYTKLMLHMDGDASDSQHTVTVNGNPQSYATGVFNGSMYFDGTGDYLTIPDSSDFDLTSIFTIDFLFKTNTSNQCCLINTGNANNSNEFQIELNRTVGKLSVYSAGQKCVTTNSWNDNVWHHCALVCDGTDLKMYIDGIKDGEETSYAPSWTPTGMNISSTGASEYYTGYIDEFRISKGIARWTSNFTLPVKPYTTDSGTVLLLHMDGDQSNSEHIVTFNGNPKIYSSEKKFNGSYYFDGTGDYLSSVANLDWAFGVDDFTSEAWVWVASIPSVSRICALGDVETTNGTWCFGFGTTWGGGTKINFAIRSGGSITDYLSDAVTITTSMWHHIAVSRYGSTLTFWLDGVSVGSSSSSLDINASDIFYIGGRKKPTGYGEYLTGYIDELRVSKGIARWTSNFVPPTGPYGSSWDNRKKIAITTEVVSPGIYDQWTKLLLHMNGDQSDSEHTMTCNGDPQIYSSEGKFNGSYYFDGNGDYLETVGSNDFNFGTDDFTIEAWVKINLPLSNFRQSLCGQTDNSNNRYAVRPAQSSGNFGFTYYNGSTYRDMDGGAAIVDNEWCHVAIVRASGVFKFFVNGIKGSDNSSYPTESVGITNGKFYVARNNWDSCDLPGYIDELRVSKGIARWTSDFTPPTEPYSTTDSGTVLLLHMDGDQSDSEHTVTFNGNPQLTSSGTDGAYRFDGTGDYLTIPDSNDWYLSGDFTIDMWIKFSSFTYYLITQYEDANNRWHFIFDVGTTGLAFKWKNSGNVYKVEQGDTNGWSLDVWYHVAAVKNNNSMKVYRNGITIASGTITTPPNNYSGNLYIGQRGSDEYYFDGYIDELRVSKGIARWTTTFSGSLPTPPYQRETEELQLPVEIERWNSIDEQAWLWTKIPTIVSGTNTDLYLYYDATVSGNDSYIGDTGDIPAQNVWTNGFVGVWHLSQDPNGDAVNCIKDSTSYEHHMTPEGTMTSDDLVDGKIGKCVNFDGADDGLSEPDHVDFDFSGGITVEADITGNTGAWASQWDSQSGDGNNRSWIVEPSANKVSFKVSNNGLDGGAVTALGSTVLDAISWYHVAGIWDTNNLKVLVNDVVEDTQIQTAIKNSTDYITIGGVKGNLGLLISEHTGKIDEVRLSKIGRSDVWVKATYYSNWDNLITFSGDFVNFYFSNPIPVHLSTVYGHQHLLKAVVTVSGSIAPSYIYDTKFYDIYHNQIGSTVSGTNSGSQVISTDYLSTPSGIDYSWYIYSTSSGYNDTSPTYTFTNMFVCQGDVLVDGTPTSGIEVRLYKRDTGELIDSNISSGISGTFFIPTPYTGLHYAVAIHPQDQFRNMESFDWLQPTTS